MQMQGRSSYAILSYPGGALEARAGQISAQIAFARRAGYAIVSLSRIGDAIAVGVPLPGRVVAVAVEAGAGLTAAGLAGLNDALAVHGATATLFAPTAFEPNDTLRAAVTTGQNELGVVLSLGLPTQQPSAGELEQWIAAEVAHASECWGRPAEHVSLPFAAYCERTHAVLRRLPLRSASCVVAETAMVRLQAHPTSLRRVAVDPYEDLDRFAWRLWRGSGGYWMPRVLQAA